MDEPLRTGLWNALCQAHFQFASADPYSYGPPRRYPSTELFAVCQALWLDYFKRPIDTLPSNWDSIYTELRDYYFNAPWNEVYDLIEFIPWHFRRQDVNDAFFDECNAIMQREMSAYRFVSGRIARVTDPVELETIESATDLPRSLGAVATHLSLALRHLGDRKSPDYRNSIKESISAVESMCALITGQDRADLSEALKVLERRAQLHGALKNAFSSLYGYTSDSGGIRHALLEEHDLSFDDAKFMLVACSAFINYLKVLAADAGVRM